MEFGMHFCRLVFRKTSRVAGQNVRSEWGGPAVEIAFVKRVGNPLFRKDEEDAIKQFMKWLSHTSYKKIFFLLYGKADTLSEQQEIENCRTMCEHAIKMNLPLGFPPNAS